MRRVQEQNRFLAVGGAECWPALSSLTTIVGVTARVTYGFLTPHGPMAESGRVACDTSCAAQAWIESNQRREQRATSRTRKHRRKERHD
jgi:hypothetical protein